MFENVSPDQKDEHYRDDEFIEEFEHKPLLICIPKVEPLHSSATDLIENTSNMEEEITPIPLTIPYKVKDPIILLERCDKIWETLKVIKNVQGTTEIDTSNELPSEITNSKSLYIEYQPLVLGNNNTDLPNFKFYVKSKKKLFHCSICGRQYTENRRLRYHSEKIHGIYIAPRRYHKNSDRVKEKDPNIVEKEEDNVEKVSLRKSENKLHTVASSLQHVSSSNNNAVAPNLHPKRSKSNSFACNNSNIGIDETIQNEQEKKLTKEVKQNEKVISTRSSTALSTCTLCKQVVRNIRKHLTDYHKIESPDFMLKNFNESSTMLESNKLKRKFSNDENETVNNVIKREHDIQNKRRKLYRQHNVQSGTRQCDICLGIYTMNSFYGHVRIHRSRGETKENFHLARNRYLNSPTSIFSSTDTSFENTNKDNSEFCKNKGKRKKMIQNENKSKNISDIKYYDKHKHICSCGRVFRNPYTLYMHKKTCALTNDANRPIIESNVNRSSRYDTRSGSSEDSGLGISITIKKKNDSYEVIDRDNTGEGNITRLQLQNFNHSKNFNAPNEVSKYTEQHRIVKIQSNTDNIDINIEEGTKINICNDIISSSSSEIVSNLCKGEEQEETETKPNNMSYKNNGNVKLNFAKRYNICVCGSKFYTKKALDIHTSKHHSSSQLLCGYCKINFPNAVAWNEHLCSVNEGKRFIFVPMELKCHHCNDILNTYKKFDEHVKNKHSNPVVPFQCFHCCKRFSNTTSRKIHFDTDHGDHWICPICNNKCYNVMKSRHEAYHYGLGFPCHFCKRTYGSKKYLLRHMKRVPHHSLSSSINTT